MNGTQTLIILLSIPALAWAVAAWNMAMQRARYMQRYYTGKNADELRGSGLAIKPLI